MKVLNEWPDSIYSPHSALQHSFGTFLIAKYHLQLYNHTFFNLTRLISIVSKPIKVVVVVVVIVIVIFVKNSSVKEMLVQKQKKLVKKLGTKKILSPNNFGY